MYIVTERDRDRRREGGREREIEKKCGEREREGWKQRYSVGNREREKEKKVKQERTEKRREREGVIRERFVVRECDPQCVVQQKHLVINQSPH